MTTRWTLVGGPLDGETIAIPAGRPPTIENALGKVDVRLADGRVRDFLAAYDAAAAAGAPQQEARAWGRRAVAYTYQPEDVADPNGRLVYTPATDQQEEA